MNERDSYRQLASEYAASEQARERRQLTALFFRGTAVVGDGFLILTGGNTDIPYVGRALGVSTFLLEKIGFDTSPENLKRIALGAAPFFLATTAWSGLNYYRARNRRIDMDVRLKEVDNNTP